MDKNELLKQYYQLDKQFEAAKGKRIILTILLFAVCYFMAFYIIFEKPVDLEGIFAILVMSLVLAGIHFWVNISVFGYLFEKGQAESQILKNIEKRISELE